jgi:zinc protease
MPETLLEPIRIPTRSHTLGNGMRTIVHEDRSAPIVAVHLMYHVGSRHERPGRTGLAHLLEHLLFEGSENCPKGQFDRLLEGMGGTNNGSTWLDRTNYYETVPSHAVELALWLERERMAHFLPVLRGEMLEVQRGVVINERRQSYENRPYGLADERLHELLLPEAHPYSWPTIGYTADLKAISLHDAREFFQTFYTPRNAVLVLAGDIAAEEGFRLAEQYFGDLPSGPTLPSPAAPTPLTTAGHSLVMEDRVSFPRLHRAWVVPPYGTPDWIALDVLAYLLADGESSRLQRALVRERQIAQDVDTFLYPTELHGVFGVVATARSGVQATRLAEVVEEVLEAIVRDGVTQEEAAGALRRVRRDQLTTLANVEGRAEELAYAATVLGSAEALEQIMEGYAEVTVEDVQRVAREYLVESGSAIVIVVPAAGGEHAEA